MGAVSAQTPGCDSNSESRKRLTEPTDVETLAGVLATVLRENGLTDRPDQYDSSIHSWRCEYPDHYGPCSCFSDLVSDLAARIEQARAREGALRERMEALADAWLADLDTGGIRDKDARYCWQMAVSELRAALAETDQP